ncbi:MAG TPA: LysR family transcriptional regulator [Humidesulfovibrio sp.]|nr:LysR family transcriptional regulator [Humidesulfovibrio sp.]
MRTMNLDDLAMFQAVIRQGGVTSAAKSLHRVQSSVTTRIRQLEESLGVALFLREGRRLKLSPAGRVLEGYAARLLDLAAEARNALTLGLPRGPLRLGSMESTAATRLPPVLAAFHQRCHEVRLELHTGPTARLVRLTREGALDCALVAGPVLEPDLEAVPVFSEELVLVASAGHPPIRRGADLQTRTALVFEAGCSYRQRLEGWLASQGLVPERFVELASYHAMLGCAACGMGVALVPRSLVDRLPAGDSLSAHPLPHPFGRSETVLVRRRNVTAPAVDALLALLLEPPAQGA